MWTRQINTIARYKMDRSNHSLAHVDHAVPSGSLTPIDVPASLESSEPSGRLADVFAPCFTLLARLGSTPVTGNAQDLRHHVRRLLADVRSGARKRGFSAHAIDQAQFAVVAFLDERVLTSDWEQKEAWRAHSLQFELYDRYDAGEQFFTRLERLHAAPGDHSDALEVYYLCLALGFRGRYQLHDVAEADAIAQRLYDNLADEALAGDNPLSPNGIPMDRPFKPMRWPVPGHVIALATLLLAGIIYLAMSLMAWSTADRVRDQMYEMIQPVAATHSINPDTR